jgi:hypothetical protein
MRALGRRFIGRLRGFWHRSGFRPSRVIYDQRDDGTPGSVRSVAAGILVMPNTPGLG